jgi:hypothetical protein
VQRLFFVALIGLAAIACAAPEKKPAVETVKTEAAPAAPATDPNALRGRYQ